MGGDLNLKKSWHPHLMKNQTKVWQAENQALEERKVIEKLRREREEERAVEELQKLQEANGGKVATKRVEWMYAGPSGEGQGVTEEREAYLLGKRRIDNLLKANDAEVQGLRKGAALGVDAIGGSANVGTAQDTKRKVLADPMLLIKQKSMEMQIQAAREQQKLQKMNERRDKEKGSRRHRHHHRRDRSRSRSEEEDSRRYRRHHRRDRSKSRENKPDDQDCRESHRRRSPSRTDEGKDYNRRDRHRHRDDDRRRSRSPQRDESRRRSRSPRWQLGDRNSYRARPRSPRLSYDRRLSQPQQMSNNSHSTAADSAADKLARMQADANSLEEQRKERVIVQEAKDAAENAKHQNDREGGHRFLSNVRKGAADMELGDALARGRQGLRTEVDV